ncbi:ABC transporter ATPase [Wenyingzhuangia fucanilytica]|uniref:ABC transporter ATPase n=1 Tax=Wenyingzhuangia fucanilytica TaxID=1790137 RepID=A0A1B1Y680_9FLAO|nr:ABC transporter ATPase [Wenyingzhuangia fucanilytica]ANW96273.1 ABC transporter ATPase [Wenyingzhuangia fucanilytica]
MYVPYQTLPETSRVWVYQSNRKFKEKEIEKINKMTTDFVEQWTRHGENVRGSFTILYDQFLIIAVDQDFVEVSGCSIDASVKLVQQIQVQLKVDMLNKLAIAYKESDEIKVVPMSDFTHLAKSGIVNADTIVFNNMVNSIKGVNTMWEVPAKQSWHARFFN